MLTLDNIAIWEKLDSPFEDAAQVPGLLAQLEQTASGEILDEICWEHIYHQQTVYEVTFAAVPYLIQFCETSQDPDYKLHIYLNLAVILATLDPEDQLLHNIFANSACDPAAVATIIASYQQAFGQLKPIGQSLFEVVMEKEETEKRYFLAALAVAHKNFPIAYLFSTFIENEEYMGSCPHCDTEFFLWNQEEKLVLYKTDPVFDKTQTGFPVIPRSADKLQPTAVISADNDCGWLTFYADKLQADTLQPLIPYLFGEASCPACHQSCDIADAIMASL
ncbi:hypothetical protein [Chitinophaga nivalis]|uniref:DUF1963 domain-containing protein n=1 Tax=Chitinophaga nivalis TaxID=2991709 RepID=A0ABT3IKC3_9BACT|nr:hypothetical protein [Chitinophaga nivalis]MCW3465894.1 hypothetical protein [Chitinophaga nivalis]MCW3484415.1 hypothetical protein [Chitinophaga nivalis]